MRRLSYLLLTMFFSTYSLADVPDGLQLVGQSTMKVLWFEIYEAKLRSKSGRFDGFDEPILLSLKYKRDISSKDLLKETDIQWQRQKIASSSRKLWLKKLALLWPNISKNDELSFYLDGNRRGAFYFNGELLGEVNFNGQQQAFNAAFLNIWLAENSQFPKLSRRLRGIE